MVLGFLQTKRYFSFQIEGGVFTTVLFSVGIVSALISQLSAETIFHKVWSISAETLLYPSDETFSVLGFFC